MRSSAGTPWDRFLTSGPTPRPIGPALALRVLLGGSLGPIGWLVAAFGSVLAWAMGIPAVVADLARPGDLVATTAIVVDARATSLSVDKRQVYEHDVHYTVDGAQRTGKAFITGTALAAGTSLDARTSRTRPFILVDGMRPTKMPRSGIVIALVPLVGLALAAAALRAHARGLALLKVGAPAQGRLLRVEDTGATVNKRPVKRYVFEFTDLRGDVHEVSGKSHVPDLFLDDAREPVLYDRDDPARAVLLGALPGDPRVDDDGGVSCDAPGKAVALLVPPALFVALNALCAATL